MSPDETWPALPLDSWRETYATLHMWLQVVGKTRLALAPRQNHWWHVTMYVTPRGLTTSAIPAGTESFVVDFDFIDHQLVVRTSAGARRALELTAQPVADFYRAYLDLLRSLAIDVNIHPVPVEVDEAIPFALDHKHAAYDRDAAHTCWRILVQVDRVLQGYRGAFLGKSSPVHFFWGSFDLAVTRFSGRRAPPHPGGVPNCPDYVTREAYSHEVSSCGFWPGGGVIAEPAFYAYAYPEPAGYADGRVRPGAAAYHPGLREFLLSYEAVRTAPSPDAMLREFVDSTYQLAADLGRWDRAALERSG